MKFYTLRFLLIFCLAKGSLYGQVAPTPNNFCPTVGNQSSIGAINYLSPSLKVGPVRFKVYVHVIREEDGDPNTNGTGGVSLKSINQMFSVLNRDFKPRLISFEWDCHINEIEVPSAQYHDNVLANMCTYYFQSSHRKNDGINLFLGPPEVSGATSDGFADGVPSNALFVFGNYNGTPKIATSFISHEMGHCLGLFHTHQGTAQGNFVFSPTCSNDILLTDCELVSDFMDANGLGLTRGDFVDDTQADPGFGINSGWYNLPVSSCNVRMNCIPGFSGNCFYEGNDLPCPPLRDKTGAPYTPPTGNIMSFQNNYDCLDGFTIGQGDRMRAMSIVSPIINNCLVSNGNPPQNFVFNNPNGSFVINQDIFVPANLIVESGTTVIVEDGVNVQFSEVGKLIIKPNGSLQLHGVLTSGCGNAFWEGVEVYGTNTPTYQGPTVGGGRAQGRIETHETAKIENAKTAIKLYGPTKDQSGGQISANGTIFLNNSIGVDVAPFNFSIGSNTFNYNAVFEGCTFDINNDYPHFGEFQNHLVLDGVRGVRVAATDFLNNKSTNGSEIIDWGRGIFANDASFFVKDECTFEGLGEGIYTQTIEENQPFEVSNQNVFKKCFVGIRNKGVTGGIIYYNQFEVGNYPSNVGVSPIGIYFEDEITNFVCERNSFQGVGILPSMQSRNGILINNTGEVNKEIRLNEFYDLQNPIRATNINGSSSDDRGLLIECNIFEDTEYTDIRNDEIKKTQGETEFNPQTGQIINISAGNNFSLPRIFTNQQEINTSIDLIYHHGVGGNQEPIYFSGNLQKVIADRDNQCGDSYCPPPCNYCDFEVCAAVYLQQEQAFHESLLEEGNYGLSSGYYRNEMDNTINKIISRYNWDTTHVNIDSMLWWMNEFNTYGTSIVAAKGYLNNGNLNTAIQILNQIPVRYDLSEAQQIDLDNFQNLIILTGGSSDDNLSSEDIEDMKGYENIGGHAQGWARGILTWNGEYYPPPNFEGETQGRVFQSNFSIDNKTVFRNKVMDVFPNPSSTHVFFQIKDGFEFENADIIIKNINGKFVENLTFNNDQKSIRWTTKDLTKGIYFFQFISDKLITQSGKIILIE